MTIVTASRDCARIGMEKTHSVDMALARFESVMRDVHAFVTAHPDMIVGEGCFAVVFGPIGDIKVVRDRPAT